MNIINDPYQVDLKLWDEFVLNHPYGTIFQSSNYYEIIKKTKNWNPSLYLIFLEGEIVASLLVVVQKEYRGLLGYLSSRAIIWGGPLIKNNDLSIFEFLMDFAVKDIQAKSIYIQFRNLFNVQDYNKSFKKYGFYKEDHLNILIDLSNPFEYIFDNFHKSKKRNFTKSINKGVIFKEITDRDHIQESYNLILNTYSRILLPIPHISHFFALSDLIDKEICKFFAVYYENIIIGVRIELLYNGIVYDYYAGNDETHSNKYPNDFLIANILKWGSENKYKTFDFGGAGKPDVPYSVRDHKLKFSKNLVQFGRYTRINKRVLYYFAIFGFNLWKKIRKYSAING